MSQDYIYLDYAATSPLRPEALEAMQPFLSGDGFGNPSSIHSLGRQALAALQNARQQIADALGAARDEIIFTSGGTESINLALRGTAFASSSRAIHLVASSIEHEAVLMTAEQLHADLGIETTLVPVDSNGRVNPAEVERAITPQTVLVSVMYANNEVGTVQPIREIAQLAHAHGALFHTDAVQAAGALPLNVRDLGCDFLSLSAHKFGGPRGAGILFARRGTQLAPQITGGGQESNLRSGTENVAAAVGAAAALTLAQQEQAAESARLARLRDRLFDELPRAIPGMYVTGSRTERLPGHASFVIEGLESQVLLLALDRAGIGASAGSACTVGRQSPSHVLTAMGIPEERAAGALRLSLGRGSREVDVARVLELTPSVVAQVREILSTALPGAMTG